MTRISRLFPFVALALAAAPALAVGARDRQIEPTQRVGAITAHSSEADLVKIYGRAAVTHAEFPGLDGTSTVLFAGTPDELAIEWKEAARAPRRIIVSGGRWMTVEGVAIGLSIEDLEQINGEPFDVTGSNWDQPVRVVSWKGGRLSPRLRVDLASSEVNAVLPAKLKSQRAFFDSSNRLLRRSHLVVKRLILEW